MRNRNNNAEDVNVNEDDAEKGSKSKSKSKSSSDKGGGAVQQQPAGQKMGKVAVEASCGICGYQGLTKLHRVRGPCTYLCFLMFQCSALLTPVALCAICGAPPKFRECLWDLEHYCANCNRKLGYNYCCSCNCYCLKATALDMPMDPF